MARRASTCKEISLADEKVYSQQNSNQLLIGQKNYAECRFMLLPSLVPVNEFVRRSYLVLAVYVYSVVTDNDIDNDNERV